MPESVKNKRYFLLFKPYGYLCQFTGEPGDLLLGDLYDFPKNVYSVGRLDKDSEGLLMLTNDNEFKARMIDPEHQTPKTYWVQVEGEITSEAIEILESGSIYISHKGKAHQVAKAKCSRMDPPNVKERVPPIRFRKSIPTSWIALTITEGKNRQVRKMTAAVGFPTLRLIRYSVESYTLKGLQPGDTVEFKP